MTRNLSAAVIVAVLVLAGCTGSASRSQAPRVVQKTFRFLPARLEVAAGTKVTWTNRDAVDHTVTAGDPARLSGRFDRPLGKNGTVRIAFQDAGRFPYFCSIHGSMRGEIVVT